MGIIALSGATHDIAGDGVYLTELTATQQAKYIGWQGAFYNLAKILANGGLVWLAGMLKDEFGVVHAWMIVMLMCAGIMILIGLYHIRILPSGGGASGEVNTMSDALNMLWEVIRSFSKKTYCFLHCLYHFVPVCRRICHQDCTVVPESVGCGWWIGTQHSGYRTGIWYVQAGAFILGSLLAGYYISAFGLRKTLFSLCCAFNIPFLVYFLLALYQPSDLWIIGMAIVSEYLGYGFGFVGLMLFMMQQVAPGKHQMAHYAFATGIMNLGVMLPGMMSGYLSDWLGYRDFFIWVLIATIPAFIVTWLVPFTYPDGKKK